MPKSSSQFRDKVFLHTLSYHGVRNPATNVTDAMLDAREGRGIFEAEFQIGTDATTAQAALNSGGSVLIPNSQVPRGCRVYLTDVIFKFGGTAFTTATSINISDNNDVDFCSVAIANTTGVQRLGGANVTTAAAIISGGTLARGLKIRAVGTAAGGGSFRVFVRGYFAP